MNLLYDSLLSAIALLIHLDAEILDIVWVSLRVSGLSTLIASLVGIPAGLFIAQAVFPGKRLRPDLSQHPSGPADSCDRPSGLRLYLPKGHFRFT